MTVDAARDKVFISYSHHDRVVAEAICRALEGRGRTCWMAPRDIVPSAEWAEQIIDGINVAGMMVLVFSSSSNQSPQVRREVERAVNRDIPVIPFRLENVLPTRSLEYFLSTQHWLDAFDGPVDAHVARLCEVVRGIDDRKAGVAADPDLTTTFVAAPALPSLPAIADNDLAFVGRELARQIGPIARYLVQRAGARQPSVGALVDALAGEIPDAAERAVFVGNCRRHLKLG